MGSYRRAIMTGFICRLCSENKNVVVHIYSKRAKSMGLLDKITTMPLSIKKYDNLPKTICESCIEKLCRQFDLVQQIRKTAGIQMRHRLLHGNGRCPIVCPLYGTPTASRDSPLTHYRMYPQTLASTSTSRTNNTENDDGRVSIASSDSTSSTSSTFSSTAASNSNSLSNDESVEILDHSIIELDGNS